MRYAMFLAGRMLEEKVAWAKKIEGAGFSSLWGAEFSSSPFIHLAAVASHTQKIKIGTGVALAFVRGPLLTALAALDMDEVTQGRFILGLGSGSKERNELWYGGFDQGKPVAQMREYLHLVRLLVEKVPQGEPIEFSGKFYQVKIRGLRRPSAVRSSVPIYLGAVREGMVRLAGEVANGVIGNPLFSPLYLQEVVLPHLIAGLQRAGRERKEAEVLGQIFVVISNDLKQASRHAAGAIAFNAVAPAYGPVFAKHGFAAEAERIRAAASRGDRQGMLDSVTQEMVDTFCAVGPIDRVRKKLAAYEEILDTGILAVPTSTTTPEEQDTYRTAILEAFTS